ncbi:hypothetical protein CLFO_21400 [Clostridium formicaceticum]|uniref:Uncharacterized protein n=1 Tax=Clostridium formicaceticum TaxID=1497 RepID=A0AAC9RP11_9CLOT|nr:hypothetical protein BJL90_15970 [Clostridium formicaceticum]ARE87740.1 hypothetical protein CLFO_21400 [Clostridium formicaceticum]
MLNRQQRRRVHKLTVEEIEEIKKKAALDAIKFTVDEFEKVMRRDFGFGDKRMGRVAKGLYEGLGLTPEDVEKL